MTFARFNAERTARNDAASRKAAFIAVLHEGHSFTQASALSGVPPGTVKYWADRDVDFKAAKRAAWAQGHRLPDIERDILRMIAEGYGNKQIAAEMGITIGVVCEHITRLMRKHSCVNRAMLAVAAVRVGAIVVEVQS